MIEKLKNKYVFFDVDGTLSEYRYNDKLYGGRCPELGSQTLDQLMFSNLYLESRPLKTMQKVIHSLNPDRIFVLGACSTNHEIEQKYQWLEKYYPNFKRDHIFFVHLTMIKPEVIKTYASHFNIPLDQCVFVDDRLDVLRKAEEFGIIAYHPSSFVE